MKSGIYIIYWEIPECEYFYIGQSQNLYTRGGQHLRALKRGNHDNSILQNVFNKYGTPEFEFIKFCPVSRLDKEENKLLAIYYGYKYCCNINPSATSSRGIKRSQATIDKIRASKLGVKFSDERKALQSKNLLEAYRTGKRKKKPLYGKANHYFDKKHTEEIKQKMKGRGQGKGSKNGRCKLVLDLQTGIFYDYVGEAAAAKNINAQYLRRYLNGDRSNKTSFIYA